MDDFKLELEYTCKEKIDKEKFFEENGSNPFNTNSSEETKYMMKAVSEALNIEDDYRLRKLEITLRYDLPFFATNRRLVKNWLMDNFIY